MPFSFQKTKCTIFQEVLFFKATYNIKINNQSIFFCQLDAQTGKRKVNWLFVNFHVAYSFEKEDFLQKLCILSCFVQLKWVLVCFLSFFQNAGKQLCFRCFSSSYFAYISPCCDLDIEDNEPIFVHDIMSHNKTAPYLIWLKMVKRCRKYHLDKIRQTDRRTDGQSDSPPPHLYRWGIKSYDWVVCM